MAAIDYTQGIILICKEESHNKFWRAKRTGYDVLIEWGRVGTAGQRQEKSFSSEWEADHFINGKRSEKARKGYKAVTSAILNEEALKAEIIGTANKLDQFQWAKKIKEGQYEAVNVEALSDPDVDPGILVAVTTRKEYDGRDQFADFLTAALA